MIRQKLREPKRESLGPKENEDNCQDDYSHDSGRENETDS